MTAATLAGALSSESESATDVYRERVWRTPFTGFHKEYLRCLSAMRGNSHAVFLGGWAAAMPLGYLTRFALSTEAVSQSI